MGHTLLQERSTAQALPRARSWHWHWAIIVSVLLGGLALRAWGAGSSLPYVDHLDEPHPIDYALDMMRTGDLNPHSFRKPTLYVYLLFGLFSIYYRIGTVLGVYSTPVAQLNATADVYATMPEFFVIARLLTAAMAALSIGAVYLIAARLWSRTAGLIAAVALATFAFHVRHSQLATLDVPSAAVVSLAFLGSLAIMQRGSWKAYLLAGLFVGFAASTKYNAGSVAVTVAAAHLLFWGRRWLREFARPVASGAMAVAGFLLGTPYAILATPEFLRGLREQNDDYSAKASGDVEGAWNVLGYLQFLWTKGWGPILTLALLAGVILLVRRRPKAAILWLSFAVLYVLPLLSYPTHFMRNLMPWLVLSAVPIGVAGAFLVACFRQRLPRSGLALATLALGLTFALPAKAAIEQTMYRAQVDTRVRAAQVVRSLPRGERIAVELHSLEFVGQPNVQEVEDITRYPLDWFRANHYRYLVANASRRNKTTWPAYREMRSNVKVTHAFGGREAGELGPAIEILDLGQSTEVPPSNRRAVDFGSAIRLIGFEAKPGPLRPKMTPLHGSGDLILSSGDSLQINLSWQALAPMDQNYMLFVHVLAENGDKVAQRDAPIRAEDYPTSQWRPGELVVDRADIALPELPAGAYKLLIGLYRPDTGERLPLAQPEAGSDNTALSLATLTIR